LFFEDVQSYTLNVDNQRQKLNRTLYAPNNVERMSSGPKSVYSGMSNVSNVRSVNTPMTIGNTSASSQVRSNKWSFFKGNNNRQYDSESQRSKNKSMRSENRRLIGGSAARNELEMTQKLPYPHLSSFIKRHTEYRFGKKMVIDNKHTDKTIMEEQLKQIYEKNAKKQDDKLQLREEELRGYFNLKNDIDRDKKEREIELINKRKDFLKAIDDLKQQKAQISKLDKDNSLTYQYNYFPYTHGDKIEKNREEINNMLKSDLKDFMHRKRTNPIKDNSSNRSSFGSNGLIMSRQGNSSLGSGQKQRSVSSAYNHEGDSNVFLKPHKEHYYRLLTDKHLEDNNKKALKRYEDELLKEKERKDALDLEFQSHAKILEEYKNEEKEKKRRKIQETRRALDQQHKELEERKKREFFDQKKHVNTHFGPEEGEELKQMYKEK